MLAYENNAVLTNRISKDFAFTQSNIESLVSIVHILEEAVGKSLRDEKAIEYGCHPNIPSSYKPFMDNIKKAYDIASTFTGKMRPKFLDVGCGLGVKCALAKQACFDVYGIDINQKYCDVAKILLDTIDRCGKNIECCDALKYEHYDKFDVIYFYLPIRRVDANESNNWNPYATEKQLEEYIYKNAKKQCIIYHSSPFTCYYDIDEVGFKRVDTQTGTMNVRL
jgi:SAM-dependent methyltransferase